MNNESIGAALFEEAAMLRDTYLEPAIAQADGSDANRTAMLEAEVTLRGAERGVDEHTSYLDIIRDLGYRTEYAR